VPPHMDAPRRITRGQLTGPAEMATAPAATTPVALAMLTHLAEMLGVVTKRGSHIPKCRRALSDIIEQAPAAPPSCSEGGAAFALAAVARPPPVSATDKTTALSPDPPRFVVLRADRGV